MRIDLHVHLNPHSRSSDFTVNAYLRQIAHHNLKVVTVTDYGTAAAASEIELRMGGVMVVYGAEVSTHEGQFLIYSADRKFFASLPPRLRTLDQLKRNNQTAVVWAHPRIPWRNGWRAPFPNQPLTKFIYERVDGIEFYNGAMVSMAARGAVEPAYHDELREHVAHWNVAALGGSACQSEEGFLSAWTVFPRIRTPQDFITAIKDRAVKPGTLLKKPGLQLVSV